jgi:F-type H+-transporting ATPase subunit epsilon
MQLDIITPEKILFSAQAEMVVVPGALGDFGVLPGHAPFISTIRPGIITIDLAGGGQRKVAIVSGMAEVNPESCTVLAESAEECSGITASEAEARLAAAKAAVEAAITPAATQEAAKKLAIAEALMLAV